LAALVYQLGLPAFISGHELYKSIPNLFLPLQCYKSVRTLSSQLSHADCFTVYNGKFSSVFVDDLTADAVKETRVGYVYPGLWDGHGHLIQFGESLDSVSLFGADSMDEIKRRLVEYKAGRSEKGTSEQWLRGVGWDQAYFDGKWPTSVRYLITVWKSERLMLCIVRPRDK
jgi:predicted amidohydrolase YtcJ